jgi:hypothetical protein
MPKSRSEDDRYYSRFEDRTGTHFTVKCGNVHGASLKIVDAKQARLHNSFKNTK